MRAGIGSFLFATDLVDYLVEKEIPFRNAYGSAAEAVRLAEKKRAGLDELTIDELRSISLKFEADVFSVFDPLQSVKRKKTPGSTHPDRVRDQIAKAKKLLSHK
jgi:argininosuccinate lyase